MKEVTVTAYPFATTSGTLKIPDEVTDIRQFVKEHWDDIEFGSPDLDYCGTDFEVEE